MLELQRRSRAIQLVQRTQDEAIYGLVPHDRTPLKGKSAELSRGVQLHRGRHVEAPGQNSAAHLVVAVTRLAPVGDVSAGSVDELSEEITRHRIELGCRGGGGLDANIGSARRFDERWHGPGNLFANSELDFADSGPPDVLAPHQLNSVVCRLLERYESPFAECPKTPGLFEGSQIVAAEPESAPLANRDDVKVSYCLAPRWLSRIGSQRTFSAEVRQG